LTQLTEWPSVLMGGFEPEFLALPEEVLVTVMRDHQSYFAIEDKEGKLAPHFLAVLNTEADAAGMVVIRHGNERVLKARFNDARFFWEFDQRMPLVERVKLLEHVTFQKDLGSYAKKAERMRELANRLGSLVQGRGVRFEFNALLDAASLAKTDLTTELVKEFTELQGVVGGLYAREQRYPAAVSDAIYDQYKPESMEDSVPRTVEGSLLAIVDKADTIAGMFGLGLEPTGSKDPFALRRAANGIVKILAETEVAIPLSLKEVSKVGVSDALVRARGVAVNDLMERVREFLVERLEFYLREAKGQAYDVVKAVLAAGADDVRDAVARAEAVTGVRGSDDFAAVSAAFKRMKNIVSQARDKGFRIGTFTPEFSSAIESSFWTSINKAGEGFGLDCDSGRYPEALTKLAALRPAIDGYFNSTLVMVDDDAIRAHRLGTLNYLLNTFTRIADFSEIVTAG
jgi:glycyl-tRNA synthetase beta chain